MQCKQADKTRRDNQVKPSKISHYDSLILDAGKDIPGYKFRLKDSNCRKEILLVKKHVFEIIDRNGGEESLDLKFHKFTCNGGQSCPGKIIYVSNVRGFEYAFPFDDCKSCGVSDSCRHAYDSIYNLNGHLKEISLGLKLKESELGWYDINYKFISMFAGDLLGMRELHVSDTVYLMKSFTTPRKRVQTGELRPVSPKVKQNIEEIILGLKKGDGYYYACNEGFGAFYKFSILKENGLNVIKAEYLNKEGYEGALYF